MMLCSGMKSIIAQNPNPASNCAPLAWCNNDAVISSADTVMDGITSPGDIPLNFGCNGSNLSCVFAAWFTCGYDKNSAQGILCKQEKKPGQKNPDGPRVTTEVLSSLQTGITAERIFKFYDKTKRGAVVHNYSNGYTLRLASKFQKKKSNDYNFLLAFRIVDKKNKTLANPVVYVAPSKSKKGYLILKSDKSVLDYEWIAH